MYVLDDQTCALCPALVASRSRIVHGCGDSASSIVLVGEAPGRHGADRTGVPFSGDKSGRALRGMLREIGLDADGAPGYFITNIVRCCPPRNRTPLPAERRSCAPFLWRELDAIRPRILVAVGRRALAELTERYLGRDVGPIRPLNALPIAAGALTIVPLVHPSRISRAQRAAFVAAMRALLTGRAGGD